MSQDNFAGGFLVGAVVGGLLGGVFGALAASRIQSSERKPRTSFSESGTSGGFGEFDEATEESMEAARLSLEAKIAQLNDAIDDVRQQLGGINGHSDRAWESSSPSIDA